jgi:hypothetical protein
MLRRRLNLSFRVGLLLLAAGLASRFWAHSKYGEFGIGFLLGLSIILLIVGFVRQSGGPARSENGCSGCDGPALKP